MPMRAASRQVSSKDMPRPKTPRVTVCFRRPAAGDGAGVCAAMAGSARRGKTSLRRMGVPRLKSLAQIARIGSAGEVAFDGKLDQPHQVVNVELPHEAGAVGVDGLGADFEQLGDVLGAQAVY